MAILVAAPTILVDTQLRTVLLCQNSASMTIVGSLLFAAAEIFLRVSKTVYVKWLIYSDMYAEYIAMGCSYAILFFFGSHPKYELSRVGSTPGSSNSSNTVAGTTAFLVRWRNVGTVGLQLGVEVIVDFVACALEIRSGIDFEHFNKDDSFLAVFMVAIALVNVHISSSVYLDS
ncbi:hypothetical protein BBO99_00000506 [Phytophthora kernoviae]|uniref:Uncharacterized protein n=2 Tax=Phytophthora kernoviae TaxID=325452 RepID=A0A3R7JCB5_9STRA|nr:hypothetical protein G195_001508 [Phytophthora kernoviae 00238/432]KAG2532095.1 hypothetical protein JM16_000557 [Phytophthora kernoviae]KAG2533207.1 hypothetical protein JM18_000638 [Phytophthora kernoviae]RLN26085.1 hypothetical protein BBI17_000545 [Phytophthora kernoviae]RLN85476.1 hypothetical protein BBO99_00000506 [Phytophthora kernoviae]